MAKVVPYQQLTTLLAFCKRALRADAELLGYLDSPNNIVASTLEHDPFIDQDEGHPALFRQELPCLAIWEIGAARIRANASKQTGYNTRFGEDVSLGLVYVHKVYHGGKGVSARALGNRISKLVQWRLREILESHEIDAVDSEGVFDLFKEGKIDRLEMGDTLRIPDKDHDGFGSVLSMIHFSAPYEEVTPMALKLIALELHTNSDVVPSTTGPIISGDIPIPSS